MSDLERIPLNGKESNDKKKKKCVQQSPVNIISEHVVYDSELNSSKLKIYYIIGDANKLELRRNGFCVWTKPGSKSMISGNHLPSGYEYRLVQFHMHWGENKLFGSEHYLDGKPFSGEIHCVFWNTTYGTSENAFRHSDGLTVLGIFVSEQISENLAFEPICDAIRVAKRSQDNKADLDGKFDLNVLMPEKNSFYTYPGSLTTKPHNECVIWTILRRHVYIGSSQMALLRSIVKQNVEDVRPVEGQYIRSSFQIMPKMIKKA